LKETEFIAQNKHKWEGFEKSLGQNSTQPEELTRVFIEVTDDLAYSRTFYSRRSVRVYLNGVAQQIFQLIYKSKGGGARQFWQFWKEDLPDIMWACRLQLLLSTLLFALGVTIGWVSSIYHPEFAKIILGQGYVDMTESYINDGDPMAVYKKMDPWPMFLYIVWNNIYVSFIMFVLGVFFSAGTIFAILRNSIMVGAFVFFFYERGLFQESFLTIMMHGTVELSSIILAGTAGIVTGRGLVFPGTYDRLTSFVISGRQGIKIMMGIVPFLVFAAFIEGFVTRYTEVPDAIRGLLIFLMMALMVGYFVYLPWVRNRAKKEETPYPDVPASKAEPIRFDEIKSAARIFTEVFFFFSKRINKVVYISMALSATDMAALWVAFSGDLRANIKPSVFGQHWEIFTYVMDILWFPDDIGAYFTFEHHPWLVFVLAFGFAAVIHFAMRNFILVKARLENEPPPPSGWAGPASSLFAAAAFGAIVLLGGAAYWLLLFPGPLVIFALAAAYRKGTFLLFVLGDAWANLSNGFIRLYAVLLYVLVVQWLFMIMVNAPLTWFAVDIVTTMFRSDAGFLPQIPHLLFGLIGLTGFLTAVSLSVYAVMLIWHSQEEVNSARGLKQAISQIKLRSKAYGLEKE
jgi:uncharacterized membrane protein SpoIIM required for sporulation